MIILGVKQQQLSSGINCNKFDLLLLLLLGCIYNFLTRGLGLGSGGWVVGICSRTLVKNLLIIPFDAIFSNNPVLFAHLRQTSQLSPIRYWLQREDKLLHLFDEISASLSQSIVQIMLFTLFFSKLV